MKLLKITGRIFLIIFIAGLLVIGTMIYEGYKRDCFIKKSNSNISIWQKERADIYTAEEAGFAGIVTRLSPGRHRCTIDTITVKLYSWTSPDTSYSENYYLQKPNASTVLLFIDYFESILGQKQISVGDKIVKDQFGFDFSIFDSHQKFKKELSLLFCSYVNPDTIVQKGNTIIGLYNNKTETLFSGSVTNGKRNGKWEFYEANSRGYKKLEGQYKDNRRNGVFRKYYELTNQLIYEENYKDNLPNGQFTWWFYNGQLESRRYYELGKPIGIWYFYNDKGKLLRAEDYTRRKSNLLTAGRRVAACVGA